ncbi:MAG: ATP-binding protein [Myxococcota bacterium]|nr:ATP-binding protein [Myxococcota bacterium]
MKASGFTEAEVRRFAQSLRHPVWVIRGDLYLAVNDAMVALLGHPREAVEGRPFREDVPAEERSRLFAHHDRFKEVGTPTRDRFQMLVRHADGHILPTHVEVSALEAVEGEPFLLVSCLALPEERESFAIGEALVRVSSSFVGEITEQRIRRAVVSALERDRFQAMFYRAEVGELRLLEGDGEPPEPLRTVNAYDALYEGRPVFGGAGKEISHAFIPVGAEERGEVLVMFGPFKPQHASLLVLLAKQIAGAYDNARLIAHLEQRNHQTQLLLEVARTLGGTLELTEILNFASDYLVRLVDASNCFIMMYDERRQLLVGAASSRSVRNDFALREIPLDSPQSLAALAARKRQPFAVEDVTRTELPVHPELVARYGEKALLALPLLLRDQLMGVAILDDTRRPRRFTESELELANATLGQIALSISNARLYTSLKESYEVLAEARAEMVKQERLAALGELSAIVAHEVRNPLGVIFNAVSTLRRLIHGEPDAQLLVEILAEESDRLNRLVGELLDFARPRELLMQPEDVARIIQECIEAAASDPQRSALPVVFEAQVEQDLPPVPMDRRLIRQALVNVAVNGSQAMSRGGKVRVQAAREAHEGRNMLRIDVQDEGPGMPPEVMERIFEPFFTTKAKGTGLGLAVVKRILEDHHGEVEVSSAPGEGTRFTFRIPLGDGERSR